MKIKLFFFAAVVFIMASCSQNEFDKPKVKRFLHATASVVEPTETRATLVQYVNLPYKSLRYVWEVGDVIYFCFELKTYFVFYIKILAAAVKSCFNYNIITA